MTKLFKKSIPLVLSTMLLSNIVHAVENLQQYVTNCKTALGISSAANSIPSFSCKDGRFVPEILERPGLQSDSNYIGKVNIPSAPNVDAIFLCRDYNHNSNTINLNGFILQNRVNGNTCFFDATSGTSGVNFPSLDSTNSTLVNSRWQQPSAIYGKCVDCHTADPYIVTPSLANGFLRLGLNNRSSINGLYKVVNNSVSGSHFNGWETTTTGWLLANNGCAGACHRLTDPTKSSFHASQQSALAAFMPATSSNSPYIFDFMTHTPNNEKFFATDTSAGMAYVQKTDGNWTKVADTDDNNNISFMFITGGNGKFYGNSGGSRLYAYTTAPCATGACGGWQHIYKSPNSVVTMESNGTNLVIGEMYGNLYRYTGVACAKEQTDCSASLQKIDHNNFFIHPVVATGSNIFYQRPVDGHLYRYTGTPCSGSTCNGWQKIDNTLVEDMRRLMTGDNGTLYAVRGTNSSRNGVWKYTNTACSGSTCNGWQRLDNRSTVRSIAAGGGKLYQMLEDRSIWRFNGTACSGSTCSGWVKVRAADPNIEDIKVAGSGKLIARNWNTGAWFQFDGTSSCSGSSCPGWSSLSVSGLSDANFDVNKY